jgi:nucleoid-associated protein YgaU
MQQIERYGVLALLLLVVTLVTVGLWGPDPAKAGESKNQRGADQRIASVEDRGAHPNRRAVTTTNTNQRNAAQRRAAAQQQARGRNHGQDGGLPLNNTAGNQASQRDLRDWERGQASHAPMVNSRQERPRRQGAAPQPVRQDRSESSTQQGPARRGQSNRGRHAASQPAANQGQRPNRAPAQAAGAKYKIQSGDSLQGIAERFFGTTTRWPDIAKLNGITNPNRIIEGQTLVLPAGAKAGPVGQPSSTPRARFVSNDVSGTRTYTVKSGDALSVIASRECGTKNRMGEILELNPGLKADKIYAGQKLKLPARNTVVAQAAPAAATPARAQSREDHGVVGLRAGLNQSGNSRVR